MKPSTRIDEWVKMFEKTRPNATPLENILSAMKTVLDEQWEAERKVSKSQLNVVVKE